MSDEDDFMPSCDSADYDFGYSDNEGSDQAMEDDSDPENLYYQAKAQREGTPVAAFQSFQKIINDNPDTEIAVKASKQSLKLVVKNPTVAAVPQMFQDFLNAIVSNQVNPSYRDQSFMNMIEVVKDTPEFEEMLSYADTKFRSIKGCERLSSRTTIKMANSYFNDGKIYEVTKILNKLGHLDLSGVDQWKTSLALEVLALRIQVAMKLGTGEEENLYDMIRKGAQVQVAHPRIMAVIRECGGVIAIRRSRWVEARTMLLKAFKSFDEAGLPDRMRVLQYYIVSSVLTEMNINPFDSQETLAYRDSNELSFLQSLVDAFENTDMVAFKQVFNCESAKAFASDPLVASKIIPALNDCFECKLLCKVVRPYSRVRFSFIAQKLEIDESKVPVLVTRQILSQKLPKARIDDVNKTVDFVSVSYAPEPPLRSKIPLPSCYREFAVSAERDQYEKAILLFKEDQKKEGKDLSNVYTDLLDAAYMFHNGVRGT